MTDTTSPATSTPETPAGVVPAPGVPPAQVWPCLRARDARALVDFLCSAFGFVETVAHTDDAGVVVHAELAWPPGGGVMLGQDREAASEHDRWALTPGSFGGYAVARDAAHIEEIVVRAGAAGASVVAAPYDTDYGSRDCTLLDPEGNRWQFGTYPGSARPA